MTQGLQGVRHSAPGDALGTNKKARGSVHLSSVRFIPRKLSWVLQCGVFISLILQCSTAVRRQVSGRAPLHGGAFSARHHLYCSGNR
eukprot:1739796-Amphidinium_carterae.1